MKHDQKFFICRHCGNLVGMVSNAGVPLICCGESMEELIPNTNDALGEKHVPVVRVDGNLVTVTVGSVPHPMIKEHFIEWIYLQTERGGQRKELYPGEAPEARFLLENDKPVAAFEYCNLHSLWKSDI